MPMAPTTPITSSEGHNRRWLAPGPNFSSTDKLLLLSPTGALTACEGSLALLPPRCRTDPRRAR